MSFVTSTRERRLWLWLLVVLAAIYASLGLTPTLSGMLRDRGLLGGAFVVGLLLVVAAVAAVGWRRRPGPRELGVWLGVAAAYVLAFVRLSIPEERTHLVEYGVVALLLHEALAERGRQGRRVPMPAALAMLVTACLGWVDEAIQTTLPGRVYDLRDVGFNALAGVMAVGASVALTRARRV